MTTPAAAERPEPRRLAQLRRPPTHPGEVFKQDFRLAQDPPVGQAEAARRLGWSTIRLFQFEKGRRGMTPENAIALEALTGASAEFWMNLQRDYDLWHAYQKAGRVKRLLAGEAFSAAER